MKLSCLMTGRELQAPGALSTQGNALLKFATEASLSMYMPCLFGTPACSTHRNMKQIPEADLRADVCLRTHAAAVTAEPTLQGTRSAPAELCCRAVSHTAIYSFCFIMKQMARVAGCALAWPLEEKQPHTTYRASGNDTCHADHTPTRARTEHQQQACDYHRHAFPSRRAEAQSCCTTASVKVEPSLHQVCTAQDMRTRSGVWTSLQQHWCCKQAAMAIVDGQLLSISLPEAMLCASLTTWRGEAMMLSWDWTPSLPSPPSTSVSSGEQLCWHTLFRLTASCSSLHCMPATSLPCNCMHQPCCYQAMSFGQHTSGV